MSSGRELWMKRTQPLTVAMALCGSGVDVRPDAGQLRAAERGAVDAGAVRRVGLERGQQRVFGAGRVADARQRFAGQSHRGVDGGAAGVDLAVPLHPRHDRVAPRRRGAETQGHPQKVGRLGGRPDGAGGRVRRRRRRRRGRRRRRIRRRLLWQ